MITSRAKSGFLLAGDLYLKQIRGLYYNKIYEDPVLRSITISNAIYDLSAVKQKALEDKSLVNEAPYENLSQQDPSEISPPSTELINVAEKARTMPTTLWFDEFQQKNKNLEAIVATGQFTVCYNLLKYLAKKEVLSETEKELKVTLKNDWEKFNQNPYYLFNQFKISTNNPK